MQKNYKSIGGKLLFNLERTIHPENAFIFSLQPEGYSNIVSRIPRYRISRYAINFTGNVWIERAIM